MYPILLLSVLGAFVSPSFLCLWLFLELNTMSFLLLISSSAPSQTSLKYFIIQGISSALILLCSVELLFHGENIWPLILTIMLLVKLGMPPFHLWMFNIINYMSFSSIFILSSAQKIIPLLMFFLSWPLFTLNWILSLACISLFVIIPSLHLTKPLLGLSSVFTNVWLVSTCPAWAPSFLYLFLYSISLFWVVSLLAFTDSDKLNDICKTPFNMILCLLFFLFLLNIGGMPPMLGFTAKLFSSMFLLNYYNLYPPLLLLISSVIILFMYLQPLFLLTTFTNFFFLGGPIPPRLASLFTLCLPVSVSPILLCPYFLYTSLAPLFVVHVLIFLQLMSFILIVLPILLNVALVTLLERKILGLSQSRKGPNKVSFQGLLQPFADAIKLFTNSPITPFNGNLFIFFMSPAINMAIVLWLWSLAPTYESQDSSKLTIILFLLILSLNVYPLFLSGWASNSKYPMLGATRGIAQTISYEISLALILLSLVLLVPSLSLFSFLYYYHFSCPLSLATPALTLWLISGIAESNRTPFDFSEGESELVSGFNTEYGSGGFALLFMSEYGSILLLSMVTSLLLVSSKLDLMAALGTCSIFCVWVWARTTLPRYRYDKLMNLAWKVFLPLTLCLVLFTLALTPL